MNNCHEHSLLLKKASIIKLEKAFDLSWAKETCFPANKSSWLDVNKAYGQCVVTTLIVNDLYGGKIAYDRKNNHYWNLLPDGSQHDFSRSQFTDKTILTITTIKERKEILDSKGALEAETQRRYMLLKDKVMRFLKILSD